MNKKININSNKTVLSGIYNVYKTEKFLLTTNNFYLIDQFLSKLFGGILLNLPLIEKGNYFKIETIDKHHSFYFLKEKTDIIFFKHEGVNQFYRFNDTSLSNILKQSIFSVIISSISIKQNQCDFKKLYRLSNSLKINFPLLNEAQKSIVAIEDENVLVQGVAGSGKTNLCIDKIVFSAARGYRGKILYTTYSRGLLIDTQAKAGQFKNNLREFISEYEQKNIIFADNNHKRAIENKFGIHFDCDSNEDIIKKIGRIADFLQDNVDYMLLEDMYSRYIDNKSVVFGDSIFKSVFLRDLRNHNLSKRLEKISRLSHEVIFKEIYGVILGSTEILTLDQYIEKRQISFNRPECEVIYFLALEYLDYLNSTNSVDNNLISRNLFKIKDKIQHYSLTIIDEAQDMTQINLNFLNSISSKMFCVGDALQMINPSFFSFSFLKRLLFEKDIINVRELNANYRSSQKIAQIIGQLSLVNVSLFGTHSFALKTTEIESDIDTMLIQLNDNNFINTIKNDLFNNYTIIVPDSEKKEQLKKSLTKQEILTVSEIKGLERDVVILYNILSSNIDKFNQLERTDINRKKADENSVYRYYFNLFYVAISRGKSHIFVIEDKNISYFNNFFSENFIRLNSNEALKALNKTSDKIEAEQDELISRIREFISLGQFENARHSASRLVNEPERKREEIKIDIHEKYVLRGDYYNAGIAFWETGLLHEAREQFTLSKDEQLIKLIDACIDNDSTELNIDIVDFIPDVLTNKTAFNLILDTIKKDYEKIKTAFNKEKKWKTTTK